MMDENFQQPQNTEGVKHIKLGAHLKSAREAMHLSQKDAAARLHLNVKFITMMENESFDNGLPSTFMRGYLRSYSKLLNIKDEDINAALIQLEMDYKPPVPAKPEIPMRRNISEKQTERYARWITFPVIVILLALVGVWWSGHSRETTEETRAATADQSTPDAIAAAANAAQTAQNPAPAAAQTAPIPPPGTTVAVPPGTTTATSSAPIAPATVSTPPATASTTTPPLPPTPALQASTPPVAVVTNPTPPTPAAAASAGKPAKANSDATDMQMALPEPGLPGDGDD